MGTEPVSACICVVDLCTDDLQTRNCDNTPQVNQTVKYYFKIELKLHLRKQITYTLTSEIVHNKTLCYR